MVDMSSVANFSNVSYYISIDKLGGKIFNGPLHAVFIVLIAFFSVSINLLIGVNAKKDSSRTAVSRTLLELVCLLDAFGVALVLLFPLCVAVTPSGRWFLGETTCHIDAACNVFIFLQHFVFVVASKFDSAYTTNLSKDGGMCSPNSGMKIALRRVKIFAAASTALSFTAAAIVTAATGGRFHRVLLLCIPDVPSAFYVVVLVLYFSAVLSTAVGYVAVILHAKQQQRKIFCLNSTTSSAVTAITNFDTIKSDIYGPIIRSAWASFAVTVTGLVITLPTVIVLGLPQFENKVPLLVYFIFDVIFYSEFMLNPLLLIIVNRKMRDDVKSTLKSVKNYCRRCKPKKLAIAN